MKINEKIRTLRIRSRLTQNQTADFLDVTPSFIADVENGTAALTADMVYLLKILSVIMKNVCKTPMTSADILPMILKQ